MFELLRTTYAQSGCANYEADTDGYLKISGVYLEGFMWCKLLYGARNVSAKLRDLQIRIFYGRFL